jgi:hypothetical protein
MRVITQEYEGEEQVLVIGPARNGTLLELVAAPAREPDRIFHADRLRTRFHHLL